MKLSPVMITHAIGSPRVSASTIGRKKTTITMVSPWPKLPLSDTYMTFTNTRVTITAAEATTDANSDTLRTRATAGFFLHLGEEQKNARISHARNTQANAVAIRSTMLY